MATSIIPKQLLSGDLFVSPGKSVPSGETLTITFIETTRANGLISISGSNMNRMALYAFSGLNGATPTVNRLCGADLDAYITTGTGTISFTPNYSAVVKVFALNNAGEITVSV